MPSSGSRSIERNVGPTRQSSYYVALAEVTNTGAKYKRSAFKQITVPVALFEAMNLYIVSALRSSITITE
jgi:hypothetical protein